MWYQYQRYLADNSGVISNVPTYPCCQLAPVSSTRHQLYYTALHLLLYVYNQDSTGQEGFVLPTSSLGGRGNIVVLSQSPF